ncbi:nitroreductase family protein [Thermodesulfobacteriota bacterium]
MALRELIEKNRSYRRFVQSHPIERGKLEEMVDLARLSASAANLQPLKYYLSNDARTNRQIFDCLAWAAYLKDWPGPSEGERPSAYILILGDTTISKNVICDQGIAAQSILLGAVEQSIGGCIVATIRKKKLAAALSLPEQYEIMLVIALGKPAETVEIENMDSDGNIKYWRDEHQVHHVPKRSLAEIILN